MAEDVQEKRDISADKAPLKKKSWGKLIRKAYRWLNLLCAWGGSLFQYI